MYMLEYIYTPGTAAYDQLLLLHQYKSHSECIISSTADVLSRVSIGYAPCMHLQLLGLCGRSPDLIDPYIAGIAPDWDDPQIQHGGLWLAHSSDVVARDPDNPSASYTLHDAWMDTVMHAIGEQFPDSYHVAGVALNIRKNGSRLSLWTRGTKNEAAEKVKPRAHKNIWIYLALMVQCAPKIPPKLNLATNSYSFPRKLTSLAAAGCGKRFQKHLAHASAKASRVFVIQ